MIPLHRIRRTTATLCLTSALYLAMAQPSIAETPTPAPAIAQEQQAQTPDSAAQHEATSPVLAIQNITTDAGLTTWLVEDHSIPVIAMTFAFRGSGAKTDPVAKQGRARLVSNTMDEGAGDYDSTAFQKTLQDESITLRFGVTRDDFTGTLKTITANKDTAFEMLRLALNEPRFDPAPVDRMRKANQSRIRSSTGNPRWISARLQNDIIFDGHPYALNSGGTLTSLEKLTTDDLRAFHKTLGKNNLNIAVSGAITAAELKTTLDEIFATLPDTTPPEIAKTTLQNSGKTYLMPLPIPQTIIEMTQNGIAKDAPEYHAAQVMNFILGESGFGSRLMEEIREKRGLTYGIYSYLRHYDHVNTLHISTSTENSNVTQMLDLIKAEWATMKDNGVTQTEVDDAQSYLIGSLPLSLTSTDSIAEILLSLQLNDLPIDYLDTRKAALRAITVDDVNAVAANLLDTDTLSTVLVGAPENLESYAKEYETLKELPNVK